MHFTFRCMIHFHLIFSEMLVSFVCIWWFSLRKKMFSLELLLLLYQRSVDFVWLFLSFLFYPLELFDLFRLLLSVSHCFSYWNFRVTVEVFCHSVLILESVYQSLQNTWSLSTEFLRFCVDFVEELTTILSRAIHEYVILIFYEFYNIPHVNLTCFIDFFFNQSI